MRRLVLVLLLSFPALASAQPNNFFYPAPKSEVAVHRDVEFKDGLLFDLYRPAGNAIVPIVIFGNVGSPNYRGWGIYTGWARAVADRGMAAVLYQATQQGALAEFDALMSALNARASEWKIDPSRVVVWSASANVQLGFPLIMDRNRTYIRGGVLYYGNADGAEIRSDLPVLLVRSGLDSPWINGQIDKMIGRALEANAPWTIENNAGGLHGFETLNDTEVTRVVIDRTLDFMHEVLQPSVNAGYAVAAKEAAIGGAYVRGDWPTAIEGYRAAVAARPDDGEANLRLGISLARSGKPAEGLPWIEKAWTLGRGGVRDVAVPAAEAAAAARNLDRAMHWLDIVLSSPFSPPLDELRASEAFAPIRAEARFQQLLREIEEQRRLTAELTTGAADEVVRALRSATTGRLSREAVLNSMAYAALGRQRVSEAIEIFRIATDRYPSSANAWESLSEAYEAAGKRREAVQSARKALALVGDDASLSAAARDNIRRASEQRVARLESSR